MQGLHLTGDLSGCRCARALLTDPAALEEVCVAAVEAAGLAAVNRLFHAFAPDSGITGVVLLAESHLAVHTWPEVGGVTLDVYVCNFSGDNSRSAHGLFAEMIAAFAPARLEKKEVARGHLLHPVSAI